MKTRLQPLTNFPLLARIIGMLLVIEAVFMGFALIASAVFDEGRDILTFAGATALTGMVGGAMWFFIRPKRAAMGKRDGFLLTAMVWVVFSIFGMIPFIFGSPRLSVTDAWFEAMSGFTTTGASVIADIDSAGRGIVLWRSIMQWVGGMGIILFTLAVIPLFNQTGSSVQLFNAEVTGITHDKIRPRIGQTAKSLWGVYTALTLILTGLLWIGPMSFFDALCHALSTISTGGFSTMGASILHWNSIYVKVVLMLFMFVGGVNFVLIYRLCTGHPRALWHSDVFRTFVLFIGIVWAAFVIIIVAGGHAHTWQDVTIDPLFQVVAVITSTGYACADYEVWGLPVVVLIIMLMFTGACAGSTSGGAKIDRCLVLFKLCRNELYRCLHPNSIRSVRLNGKIIDPALTGKVTAFICLYICLVGLGVLVLASFGVPVGDAFFSSFSCVGNTGIGTGLMGVSGSYAVLPAACKWILTALMVTGRLEIFTILVLLSPNFWRR